MASISSRNLVDAVLRVERMSIQERERLAEEVHAEQPKLFFSVLVLQRALATARVSSARTRARMALRDGGVRRSEEQRRPTCRTTSSFFALTLVR